MTGLGLKLATMTRPYFPETDCTTVTFDGGRRRGVRQRFQVGAGHCGQLETQTRHETRPVTHPTNPTRAVPDARLELNDCLGIAQVISVVAGERQEIGFVECGELVEPRDSRVGERPSRGIADSSREITFRLWNARHAISFIGHEPAVQSSIVW